MNPLFLTNRENFPAPPPRCKSGDFFGYREEVAKWLMTYGIPLRPAELATIDFRTEVHELFKGKLTAKEAAVIMVDKVRQVYKITRV